MTKVSSIYQKITKRTGLLDFGYAGVPCCRINDHDLLLFDSGMEDRPDIFDKMDAAGLRVRAVLHTHLHTDHWRNNALIARRYHAEFFADEREITDAAETLASGKDKEYEGFDPALYTPFTADTPYLDIDGTRIRLLPTPGHSPGHTAFITPDRVLMAGDSFVSQKVLDASKIPYFWEIEEGIRSMLTIADTDCDYYVPAHKGIVRKEELKTLLFNNIATQGHLTLLAAGLADTPLSREDLITRVFEKLSIPHLQHVYWIRYMVESHIDKALRRGMLVETDGVLRN